MKKVDKSSGFGLIEALLVLSALVILILVGWYVYHKSHMSKPATTNTSTSSTSTPSTTSATPSTTSWIVDAPDLNGLLAYAKTQPGGVALVTSVLNHPTTYVMTGTTNWPIPTINGANSIPTGWSVTPAIITPDLAGVSQAAAQHEVAIFDLELPVRPGQNPSEQQNPAKTFATARSIMGSGTLIAVPGDNLALGIDPAKYTNQNIRFQGMTDLNIAGQIAPSVNYYDVQAQGLEYQTIPGYTYQSFVSATATQVLKANPKVGMYSSLVSVNSGGKYETPQQIYDAANSVTSQVKGFWLGMAILPYPWTTSSRALPNYSIPYQFLKMWSERT